MNRTVPPEYEGLWRRTVIHRSNGVSDTTTQVWWFQSSSLHFDLRIPVDHVGVTGFAGVTVVDGEQCAWHPAIAFPAISSELDAGWMRFDDADHLHETGLDNSYEEDWYREPTGPMHGLRLEEVNGDAIAILLISDQWMAWACGSPDDKRACSEFAVYRREHDWQLIASNVPSKSVQSVALNIEEVLLWKPEETISLDTSPGKLWRPAGAIR